MFKNIRELPPSDNPPQKNGDDKDSLMSAKILLPGVIIFWVVVIISATLNAMQSSVIPYSDFEARIKNGSIKSVVISDKTITGKFEAGTSKATPFTTYRVDDNLSKMLSSNGVTFSSTPPESPGSSLIFWIFWAVLAYGIMSLLLRKPGSEGGLNASFMGIEKSRAKIVAEDKVGVSFADVAGVDEAIEELQEVVSFLKEPSKYNRLGGRLPKGLLLVGPPGTGKTLLAKAVAGEAGVPFFSISGSEFVELFVGVGAARVRDLFAQARLKAPCIIFIDELDALGRSRSASPLMGGHDEKEQTLNQLLVELDGFDTSAGVILLAATNRPEILDKALLRAGRFDRHVVVDRPDKSGRESILRVHLRNVTVAENIAIAKLAAVTPGFTGADLANVANEAALLAARRGADQVETIDFENAIERTVAGLEKKNRILSEKERRVVAYHEMGHALVSLCLPSMDSVAKVSIIPRGIAALGYTLQRPEEDRYILSSTELRNKLAALLGGRASEILVFGDTTTGAADDIAKATDLARSMITRYGMHDRLGLVAYESTQDTFLEKVPWGSGPTLSEETTRDIECALQALIAEAYKSASDVLAANRIWLERCAERLLHDEILNVEDISSLKPAVDDQADDAAPETSPSINNVEALRDARDCRIQTSC
jgi:cell division protease FtsH